MPTREYSRRPIIGEESRINKGGGKEKEMKGGSL